MNISSEYSKNSLIEYLKESNDRKFINYLITILEWNMFETYSDRQEKSDIFLEKFSKMYSKSTSSYYKTRYAYQMIRISRYYISPEKAISIYDEYLKTIKTNSIIKYWALEHVAGAYLRREAVAGENDRAIANYLFSIVCI